MQADVRLNSTSCAICGTFENSTEVFPANFTLHDFNPEVFSARRLPDKIHYRIVKCNTCGLVRSDPVLDPTALGELYKESRQTYDAEVANLEQTYGSYLARLARHSIVKGKLLEIGCGNGFFLNQALRQGYADVMGIEPSLEAVSKSAAAVKSKILCDVFRPGLLAPEQFDVICMFQVFDHIADPNSLLSECYSALKSGGIVLLLNHNVTALSARLMGEHSPIYDIEHTFLYSKTTIKQCLLANRFKILEIGPAINTVSLRYLFHLIPLPGGLKRSLLAFLARSPLGEIKLQIPLGNLYAVAQKPWENPVVSGD